MWIVALALLGAGTLWSSFNPEELALLVSEGALIEQGTALLYVIAAAAVWLLPRNTIDTRSVAALCVVMVAFGAREMDLHRNWTATSMLKVSFYLGDAPATHKLVALAVLAVVFWALLHVIRSGTAWVASGLRSRDSRSMTIMLFVVTAVVSKILDRSSSILVEDFGVVLDHGTRVLIQATEELLELGLPLLALAGVAQHRHAVAPMAAGSVPAGDVSDSNGSIAPIPVTSPGNSGQPR